MSEKVIRKQETKLPESIRMAWEEVRLCATLLREGKARIVIVTRADGSTYRYTKAR